MVKFKSFAWPSPDRGRKPVGKSLVVPDQSMSLETILARFTRGESVMVGKDVQYHESDDDLEKVSRMDLVDKAEYTEKLKQTQINFEKQEKLKDQRAKALLKAQAKAEALAEAKNEAEQASKADKKP